MRVVFEASDTGGLGAAVRIEHGLDLKEGLRHLVAATQAITDTQSGKRVCLGQGAQHRRWVSSRLSAMTGGNSLLRGKNSLFLPLGNSTRKPLVRCAF